MASNIILANIKGKSQKPDDIYELIEKMMPGAKKIELFARNNNLREGWLSLGNQLGENFQQWKNIISCDSCDKRMEVGVKRFKSKLKANYDICEACYKHTYYHNSNITLNNHKKDDFFEFKNNIDEDVLHMYFSCNKCSTEPIWGNRFQCIECQNYDLCEACFDEELQNEDPSSHIRSHHFQNIEVNSTYK